MATRTFARGGINATSDFDGTVATADDLVINEEHGPVVNGLAMSSIRAESVKFIEGAIGRFGGGNDGAWEIRIDNSADAQLVMRGTRVEATIAATGGKVEQTIVGPGNKLYTAGGEFEDVVQDGGYFLANASTVVDNYVAGHGESLHRYNATAGTLFEAVGGRHLLEREYATINVGQDAQVILDFNDAITPSGAMYLWGGTVIVLSGAIPTVYGKGSVLDLRKARKDQTLGGTVLELLRTSVKTSPRVDVSNISAPFGYDRDIAEPTFGNIGRSSASF